MTRQRKFPGTAPGRLRSAGLATVEFVVAVPLLIFLVIAVGEIGRALVQFDMLTYATRNAARYVSEHAINGSTGVMDLSVADAAAKRLTRYGDLVSSTPVLPGFDSSGTVTLTAVDATHFELLAEYPYQTLVAGRLPSLGTGGDVDTSAVNLRVAVTMRAIY